MKYNPNIVRDFNFWTNVLFNYNKPSFNYASAIDPEALYPVSYTIKQDGTKVSKSTEIKGKDMTEKQIKEYAENLPYRLMAVRAVTPNEVQK